MLERGPGGEASRLTMSNDGPKIFIVADSEGPTGVAEYWARNLPPTSPRLRSFRELMTGDVNAAIQGCFDAGASAVVVKDDGFRDRNILPALLDPRAQLILSGDSLLDGLDEHFAGVLLVGFHAMEGATDAVLAHTWSSTRRRRYWFNGREGGELAAYAIAAGPRPRRTDHHGYRLYRPVPGSARLARPRPRDRSRQAATFRRDGRPLPGRRHALPHPSRRPRRRRTRPPPPAVPYPLPRWPCACNSPTPIQPPATSPGAASTNPTGPPIAPAPAPSKPPYKPPTTSSSDPVPPCSVPRRLFPSRHCGESRNPAPMSVILAQAGIYTPSPTFGEGAGG